MCIRTSTSKTAKVCAQRCGLAWSCLGWPGLAHHCTSTALIGYLECQGETLVPVTKSACASIVAAQAISRDVSTPSHSYKTPSCPKGGTPGEPGGHYSLTIGHNSAEGCPGTECVVVVVGNLVVIGGGLGRLGVSGHQGKHTCASGRARGRAPLHVGPHTRACSYPHMM